MERLTNKARYEAGYDLNKCEPEWKVIDRLGQYEDTGLKPEQVQELEERDTAKPVTEICGACGEKYECPNCGSVLQDMDVFAGYCKWCGQRIKLEDDNEQI